MALRSKVKILFAIAIVGCAIQLAAAGSYRSEVEITPAPLEEDVTTKKSGLFGGFKSWFRGSSSQAITTTPSPDYAPQGKYNALPDDSYARGPQTNGGPRRPPPITIPQAPLMPLGPRPDTPSSSSSSSWPGNSDQGPPQWPQSPSPQPQSIGTSTTTTTTTERYSQQSVKSVNANSPTQNYPFPQQSQSSGSSAFGSGSYYRSEQPQPGSAYSPYRPRAQPSGFDLSYGGATQYGRPSAPRGRGYSGGDVGVGGNAAYPEATATATTAATTTSTTLRSAPTPQTTQTTPTTPPAMNFDLRSNFDNNFIPTTTTRRPSLGRNDFPSLPSSAGGGLPSSANAGNPQSAGSVWTSDDDFYAFTEELYSKEAGNLMALLQVNPQGQTRSVDSYDEAPQPLLQVDPKALDVPTIAKMRQIFNNYEQDSATNEYVSPQEDEFIDAIMSTAVMRHAMLYLQNKGIVTPDPKSHRDLLKELWFTQHSRGSGRIGSSGFESVFLHEVNDGTLSGLHNWVYFHEEEKAGRLDYKGYMSQQDLGSKGKVMKVRFSHNGVNKPVNTLFIGTSPELELALYTVCFKLRPDRSCPVPVSLGNSKFGVSTLTWRYRGKNLIGRAYPTI